MRTPASETWDQQLGRAIRRVFAGLLYGPRNEEQIEDWERAKMEAWDEEERQARERSSEELHDELDRSTGDSGRDPRP
jgi:hypothetical protein